MITVLNANGQTVAHFVNNVSEGVPYFEPTLTENIETLVSTFSFSVPLDCDESQYLKGLNKVLVKDKDGDLRQFNIIHTEEVFQEVDSRILVECEDFSISEMNDTVIYPFNGHNLGDTLTKAVQGTGWSVEYSADTWQEVEEPFILADYTNMREVFGNIQKTYDVDFKFTAERTAFNQTKRIVKVYKNRGVQTGRYFTYDRDVLGITRDVRYDTIKTAILPYYTGVEGKVWTLKGMVPVNPIEGITKDKESPLVVHNQAHADYDEPFFFKAMPFKASSTNPEQVYRQGVEELLKYIAPVYTYTVNVILLNRVQGWEGETLALGDTVWMKERVGSREIGLEARVIEYVYHEDDPSLDEVTFTNFREIDTYDTSDIAGIRDALNDLKDQVGSNTVIIESTREQISKLEEGQSGIIEDLGNKNSISIGDTPKPNPIDGDTWFSTRVNEAGQTIHEIKVWNGVEKVWKLSMDTSKAFEAEDTAKAAQKDAEESLVKANQAVEDADTAKTAAQEALDRYNKLMISGRNLALNSQKITIPDTDGATSINRRKSIPLSIKLKPNTQYLLRFKYELESGTLPESITVVLWHGSGFASNIVHVPTKASNVGEGSATLTTNSSEANVLFMYQGKRLEVKQGDSFLFTEVYLVEGDKIGDWQPAPEDAIASITNINGEITSLVTKTDGLETSYSQISQTVDEIQLTVGDKADKSQITQLQDQINLRVEKDDVINQINVSTEGIIIDGAKVQITGKTYIEDAVITDAMVSDLSATKLTAGVIDASKINVTNIDASNIKAGTIQGIDIIGSKITNPFSIGSEGYTLDGQTVMERAQVKIDYTVSETSQKGWSILHARGIQNQLLNADGTVNSFSSLASDGLSIQDALGNSGYLSAELLMQFSNTGKKIYPGNSWVTNTDRITPSLTMNKCAIGWLLLWQPYDTAGGQPYGWDYTYYLVPKAHANFNNGKGINMRLQGAGKGEGASDTVYKYVYVSNNSITGTANNGTGNGAKWVLTSVFSV
ncbi:minor structural protein [Enterococcus phage Entf1]|nr:minor structural protein [Enterococcus phage Entf1]